MNYYNDNDPKSCAWLRELIAAGEEKNGEGLTCCQPFAILSA